MNAFLFSDATGEYDNQGMQCFSFCDTFDTIYFYADQDLKTQPRFWD